MKYAPLIAVALAASACETRSPIGCQNDRDCKGDRICDPVALVCVDPRPPASADLAAPPDMASPGPDLQTAGSGTFVYAKRFGGSGADQAYAVATDRGGGLVVAGSFQGTVDFGGGPLGSQGGNDVFLVRYSSDGAFLWSRAFGGAGDDLAYGVAVDGNGNIALAGAFTGTTDFGGGPLPSAGGYDVVVGRYGADGKHLFSARAGGATDDAASSVAVDGGGALTVAGYFTGAASFGAIALVSAGGLDLFVARYEPGGAPMWARGHGGAGEDFANRVAVDSQGNAAVVGYFHGAAGLGGAVLTSAGKSDLFVARYGADGGHRWSRGLGGAEDDGATAVALDPSGNAVVFGLSLGAIDLGGGVLQGPEPYGLIIGRFSPAGDHLSSRRFGATAPVRAGNLAIDRGGAMVLAGSFNDTVALGGEPLTNGGIYVARYSSAFAPLWSRRFGGLGNTDVLGVATDAGGHILLAGDFGGSVDFGGGPFQSAGDYDAFVLKLSP